jgi:hypothetical protein
MGARSSQIPPFSNLIMITMMLLLFFIQKMEQQHGPQAVNQVQNIGKIEQITFLQLN